MARRDEGARKNTAQLVTLFALSNLRMVRCRLEVPDGQVRASRATSARETKIGHLGSRGAGRVAVVVPERRGFMRLGLGSVPYEGYSDYPWFGVLRAAWPQAKHTFGVAAFGRAAPHAKRRFRCRTWGRSPESGLPPKATGQ